MSSAAATLCEDLTGRPDPARSGLARQIEILDRLAEIGLQIAEAIGGEVEAIKAAQPEPDGEPSPELKALSRAYDRVYRAVRLGYMLRQKLAEGLNDTTSAEDAAVAERKAFIEPILKRIVERANRGTSGVRMAYERLERDFIGDILSRPVSEIIAIICKDLDVDPRWARIVTEAWALEEIESGEVGWPLEQFSTANDAERETPLPLHGPAP